VIAFQLSFRVCHQEVHENKEGLELSVTHQPLVYADVNLLGKPKSVFKKVLLNGN
jgi:hypothetical protein